MNNKIKINKKFFESCVKKCGSLWLGHQTIIFLLLLIIALGFGGYFWYKSLYESSWSDQRKQEFMNSKDTSVKLKEGLTKKVLQEIDSRDSRYKGQPETSRNIFAQ